MGHGFAEPVEIARRDGQGRRQVDDVAEGTDPNPLLHEARLERREIGCACELDSSDGSEDADVGDTGEAAKAGEPITQAEFDRPRLIQARLGLEQVEAGIGGGAGERV